MIKYYNNYLVLNVKYLDTDELNQVFNKNLDMNIRLKIISIDILSEKFLKNYSI